MVVRGNRTARQGGRWLIALAIAGLLLPPWPAIGPCSHAAASQTNRMAAALPKQAIHLLARVGHWLADPAGLREAAARVAPGLPVEEPPPAPDQEESTEFPSEGDDLAEPTGRVQLVVRERDDPSDPARPGRAGRPDLAARAISRDRLRSWSLSSRHLPPLDAPIALCRLTC